MWCLAKHALLPPFAALVSAGTSTMSRACATRAHVPWPILAMQRSESTMACATCTSRRSSELTPQRTCGKRSRSCRTCLREQAHTTACSCGQSMRLYGRNNLGQRTLWKSPVRWCVAAVKHLSCLGALRCCCYLSTMYFLSLSTAFAIRHMPQKVMTSFLS